MPCLERKLDTAPELVVLANGARVVIEKSEEALRQSLANQHPHPLDCYGFIRIIKADLKYKLYQIARLQIFPILPLWYPKCARRICVIHLSIFKAPSVDQQIWFPHITYLTCSENDSNSLQLGHANSVGRSFDYAEPTYS